MNRKAMRAFRRARTYGLSIADRIGPARSEHEKLDEAATYWSTPTAANWQGNSHWHNGIREQWAQIGDDHLALYRKLALVRGLDSQASLGTVVEWGVGGGANAVAFAPHADRFIAVDVAAASLEESRRRTNARCDTPFDPVLIDLRNPEAVIRDVGRGSCDLFLCLYVFELVPSPAYVLRILDIARQLLTPTGAAFVQIKYRDHADRRPPRRNYARNLASQTIFPIDEFWIAAGAHGFDAQGVVLVPRNELDRNYAYFLLTPAACDVSDRSVEISPVFR